MEDTLKNLNSRDKTFKHTFDRSRNIWNRYIFTPTLEWYWKCVLVSYIKKMLAILAGILSVAVVWSELTFFNKQPVLSIFANIVNVAKVKYDYTTIEVTYNNNIDGNLILNSMNYSYRYYLQLLYYICVIVLILPY